MSSWRAVAVRTYESRSAGLQPDSQNPAPHYTDWRNTVVWWYHNCISYRETRTTTNDRLSETWNNQVAMQTIITVYLVIVHHKCCYPPMQQIHGGQKTSTHNTAVFVSSSTSYKIRNGWIGWARFNVPLDSTHFGDDVFTGQMTHTTNSVKALKEGG